jgi:hypothetical protein
LKYLLTIFIATLITVSSEAQTFLGFGGSANTSTSSSSDQSIIKPVNLGINLSPRLGYLFNNKIALGIGYSWGTNQTKYEKTSYTTQTIYKTNNWYVCPFLRLYFAGNKKVSFILDNSYRYGKSISSTKVGNSDAQTTKEYLVKGYYLEPLISYNFSQKFALEMSIGNFRYNTSTEKTSEVTTSGYYYSFGLDNITGRLIFKMGGKKSPKESTLDKYN